MQNVDIIKISKDEKNLVLNSCHGYISDYMYNCLQNTEDKRIFYTNLKDEIFSNYGKFTSFYIFNSKVINPLISFYTIDYIFTFMERFFGDDLVVLKIFNKGLVDYKIAEKLEKEINPQVHNNILGILLENIYDRGLYLELDTIITPKNSEITRNLTPKILEIEKRKDILNFLKGLKFDEGICEIYSNDYLTMEEDIFWKKTIEILLNYGYYREIIELRSRGYINHEKLKKYLTLQHIYIIEALAFCKRSSLSLQDFDDYFINPEKYEKMDKFFNYLIKILFKSGNYELIYARYMNLPYYEYFDTLYISITNQVFECLQKLPTFAEDEYFIFPHNNQINLNSADFVFGVKENFELKDVVIKLIEYFNPALIIEVNDKNLKIIGMNFTEINFPLNLDISFKLIEKNQRVHHTKYSSKLSKKLNTIRNCEGNVCDFVLDNIYMAKILLKTAGIYKTMDYESENCQLTEENIENWILENDGSLIEACKNLIFNNNFIINISKEDYEKLYDVIIKYLESINFDFSEYISTSKPTKRLK